MKTTIKKHVSNVAVGGKYAWLVMEGDEVVQSSDKYQNHIFSGGLDFLDTYTWAQCFTYCRVGNQADPDFSTGDYELLNSNALQNELETSGPANYYTGIVQDPYNFSGCHTIPLTDGTTTSGLTLRRTFDFSENTVGETSESPDVTYTEIGWSPTAGGNLFSRIVTHTGDPEVHTPINVQEGQFLRVIYELNVTFDTGIVEYTGDVITGYTGASSGFANVQTLGLSSVDPTGDSVFWDDSSGANEPSVVAWGFLSNIGDDLSVVGSAVDRSTDLFHENRCHHFTYTPGTFKKVKRFFVSGDYGVYTGWNCMGIGIKQNDPLAESGVTAERNNFVYMFYEPFDKVQDYVLNVLFEYSWSGIS